jgi:predicted secreted protein
MAEVPERLVVSVGEERTIRLPGLATAGYRWQASVDDGLVATVASHFDSDVAEAAAASSSRDELVTVKGKSVGQTCVRLAQRRSWEEEKAPIASHVMQVEVVAAAQQTRSEGRSSG